MAQATTTSNPSSIGNPTSAIHLGGHPLPPLIELESTSGGYIDLFLLSLQRPVLLFIYPRTASEGEQISDSWKNIPGAFGCTSHLQSVQESLKTLQSKEKDLVIFGLSGQSSQEQKSFSDRFKLDFPLLNDKDLLLQKALDLPTFTWNQNTYLQRITLLLREGQVTQYQFPIPQPTKAAEEALKMLDAGKPTTEQQQQQQPSAMSMNNAYPERKSELSVHDIYRDGLPALQSRPRDLTGSIRSFKGLQRAMRQTSSVGNSEHPLASSNSASWRNSLVAVDNQSGEIVGILAHNVTLTGIQSKESPGLSSSEEEEDEIPTPSQIIQRSTHTYFDKSQKPKLLKAATAYHDPDVRPRSREGSVLGEDTFAPPPVPEKPDFLRDGEDDDNESEAGFSDGEAIENQVRTRAKHVEAHRPDLLRDGDHHERGDDLASDVSGSTIGGPAVQLWNKARGGKQGEQKRKQKKEKKLADKQRAIDERAAIKTKLPITASKSEKIEPVSIKAESSIAIEPINEIANVSSSPAPAAQTPPSIETVNAARANRGGRRRDQMATSQVQSIEDRVWQSALENESLPIDAPYTHLPFQSTKPKPETINETSEEGGLEMKHQKQQQRSIYPLANQIMQGNSVLIEFLAGSRIAASIIHETASHLLSPEATAGATPSQNAARIRSGPDAFSPTSVEPLARTGALRYIPVLPSHLLWFFGMNGADDGEEASKQSETVDYMALTNATANNIVSMGSDMASVLSSMALSAPTQVLDMASRGASSAWSGMSYWGAEASNWIGTTLTTYLSATTSSIDGNGAQPSVNWLQDESDDLHTTQPGDEDASEWEWKVPESFGPVAEEDWTSTPRPVYRRKRPVPSLYGGFQVRQQGDSVIHENANTTAGRIPHGELTIERVQSSRYSIVHFDHEGVGRHALLNAGMSQ